MSPFEERWRQLARSAGRAPEPETAPPDRDRVRGAMLRGRAAGAPPRRLLPEWAPDWALPAAAILVLYALALPAAEAAWHTVRTSETLANPLNAVPRAPRVPTPPVPTPPPLPRPPVASGSTELLEILLKEMQP